MHHFRYRNGILHAESVPLPKLADIVGTPFYCYATAAVERHYRLLQTALPGLGKVRIHYALKANANMAVVQTLANLGAGADVVSEGEMRLALAVGIPPQRIVFSGVGKTTAEIAFALQTGILQLNVESEPELETINHVATELGRIAPVSFRVNPDIDAHTHHKITTGRSADKFGVALASVPSLFFRSVNLTHLNVVGLATHIGSQITTLQPFKESFLRIRSTVEYLRASGFPIQRIDLGGGLGVPYDSAADRPPSPAAYAAVIRETLGDCNCQILLEPGRLIVANAGILVTRVLYVKEGSRTFVIVDAAMNDLIRPSLYDAFHAILPVTEPIHGTACQAVDVVGPICETGDVFAHQRSLTPVGPGDLLALTTAGAYGAAMASSYNLRPLIPEVLVKGDEFAVVRRRPSYKEMLTLESLPPWLL
ncbi:Diaminopimelate decarboxylase [invertebrate metagenome]|uniref:Diaminopimelate decarboxylase n=1 Tax=invertebrate metagenome TaxID=1711999 RepID=A0A484H9W6_9ZZZZ